jgi:hypothetical protein
MSQKLRIFLIVCLLALTAPAISRAATSDSLYNAKSARKLDPSKTAMFGPQSGKFRYDKRMIAAAEIAASRAKKHSTSRCWRYVKNALLAAHVVGTRPETAYAKQAAAELTKHHGFKKISERNPYKAPLGSVIVYGGRGAGHVEIKTAKGFVSDFVSAKRSPRPVIGIYIKPRA